MKPYRLRIKALFYNNFSRIFGTQLYGHHAELSCNSVAPYQSWASQGGPLKRIALVSALAAIAGCGVIPSNKSELLQSGPRSERYCYSEAPAEITQRVREYLFSCYRTVSRGTAVPVAGAIVPVKSTFHWEPEEEPIVAGTQFTVRGTYGYVLGAQVSGPERQCSAVLQVIAGNQMWSDRFVTLDRVARKEKVDCPY